jgi:type II secretory pathway pseudopilin PulG
MIRPKANSFTLVEMIGAMAILAILASVLAPSVVRQIQTATSVGEDANLADIAQALTNGIRATGIIPNPNLNPTNTNANGFGWAYLASNYTRLAGSKLVSVFPGMTNETGRRLYLSTNLVALASQGGFANTVSNWGATLFPTNAKMYLVSASRPEFNLLLATNGAGAQTNDNSYASAAVNSLDSWVKQFSTNGVTVAPTNIVDPSWTNRGEFLHVRTIDLAPIFSEVKAAQQKAIEQEDKNLEEIARALMASIQATGTIPNPNVVCSDAGGWLQLAAPYSSLGQDSFQFSFPGTASSERRVYLETSLAAAPLATPAGGWSAMPASPACLYIVSSSKKDLGLSCIQNGVGANALVAGEFNWLRSWTKAAGSDGLITATNTIVNNTWTNRGEFLHVKVVDLRPLFCRVELIDTAAPVVVDMANVGSGYSNVPSPININGTTINYLTNGANTNVSILNFFPAQRQSGLNNRATNQTATVNQVDGASTTFASNRITTPGAPQFGIGANAVITIPNQQTNFYVIQGTTLRLISPPNVTTNSSTIQKDCQFEYYGGNWRQLY